jgi:hypothetical protein
MPANRKMPEEGSGPSLADQLSWQAQLERDRLERFSLDQPGIPAFPGPGATAAAAPSGGGGAPSGGAGGGMGGAKPPSGGTGKPSQNAIPQKGGDVNLEQLAQQFGGGGEGEVDED